MRKELTIQGKERGADGFWYYNGISVFELVKECSLCFILERKVKKKDLERNLKRQLKSAGAAKYNFKWIPLKLFSSKCPLDDGCVGKCLPFRYLTISYSLDHICVGTRKKSIYIVQFKSLQEHAAACWLATPWLSFLQYSQTFFLFFSPTSTAFVTNSEMENVHCSLNQHLFCNWNGRIWLSRKKQKNNQKQ